MGLKTYPSFYYCFVIFLFFFFKGFSQYDIPNIPENETSVYDKDSLLTKNEHQFLKDKLIRYSDSTSTQIVIAIIPSTKGENINYLGANWLTEWGIGQKDKDNGVLILLAKNDRKIAINTGYGVEHLLTDAMSKRIIERDIIPYFKQDNYFEGLNNGIDSIFELLTGAYKNNHKTEFPFWILFLIIFIFIILVIAISKGKGRGGSGRRNRRTSNAADIIEAILLSQSGRGTFSKGSSSGGFGGWSSGGSSSGGFSGGFGGGMGGGGGASGSW